MGHLQYRSFDGKNKRCRHVVLTDRAYAAIISEVLKNGRNETGGVLVGNIANSIWYVIDSLDPGLTTTNTQDFFRWDANYVNHLVETISLIYHYPVTIIGFWHRHPGSMDFFSGTDENTIRSNLRESRFGLLSMLVNLDPDLRMTFYYCWEESLFRVGYDVGDEYFPVELLKYATPARIAKNIGTPEAMKVRILPNKVYSADSFPKSLSGKNESAAGRDHAQQNVPEQTKEVRGGEERSRVADPGEEKLKSTVISQYNTIKKLGQEKAAWEKERQELERKIDLLKEENRTLSQELENCRTIAKDVREESQEKTRPIETEVKSAENKTTEITDQEGANEDGTK